MDIIDRYEEAATGFTARLDAVTDDQWTNPTPCTDWDVRELVDHVIAIQRQLPEGLGVVVDDGGADVRATWKAVRDGRVHGVARARRPRADDARHARQRGAGGDGAHPPVVGPSRAHLGPRAPPAATNDSAPRSPQSCSSA